jgi:predicted homoserine dehydrogenase-like protein
MVDTIRAAGFSVVAAGKGTKYLPAYHASTPDTVWPHYGIDAADAKAGGMNAQMFNSFLDGTKSAIEMAAVANATGLTPAPDGLAFPACGVDDLPRLLKPVADGGVLHHRGQVEVISSVERDGRPVFRDLRWGVYVTFAADTDYVRRCFKEYGLLTDAGGNFTAMYKPYHLIGLELGITVASVGLRAEPTGDDVLLVAVSGYGRERDRQAAREAGFDLHLTKPADPDEVLRVLSERRELREASRLAASALTTTAKPGAGARASPYDVPAAGAAGNA